MYKPIIVLIILSVLLIAGCQRGITGQAVRDVDQQTSSVETTTVKFAYVENQKTCENGVWRKQVLANGTVKEYCNRQLARKACDIDGRCGNYEECFNGYCRPVT